MVLASFQYIVLSSELIHISVYLKPKKSFLGYTAHKYKYKRNSKNFLD